MNTIIITYAHGNTESIGILYEDSDAVFRMYAHRTGVSKVEHFNDDGVSIKSICPGSNESKT